MMKKFALITGASGGIGIAIAKELASCGWNLYLHYNQNKQKIMELIDELNKLYEQIELIPINADLSTDEGPHILVNSIFQLDAIVCSSGVAPYGLFIDLDEKTMDKMLKLHVKSPMVLIQALLPRLLKKSDSKIVLISSIWGQTGAACEVIYSTVKGAQIALVKSLSKELARSGLTVNCIAPGAINTNMLNQFSEDEIMELEAEIPVGRLGKPEEIANTVSFLLSNKATYITGQVLAVNGGWYT